MIRRDFFKGMLACVVALWPWKKAIASDPGIMQSSPCRPDSFKVGQVWVSPPFTNGERAVAMLGVYNHPDNPPGGIPDFRLVYMMHTDGGRIDARLGAFTSYPDTWLKEGWLYLGTIEEWAEQALEVRRQMEWA